VPFFPVSRTGSERYWLCKGKGLHFFVYPPSSAGERGGFNKPGGKFLSITMDSEKTYHQAYLKKKKKKIAVSL